MPNKFIDALSSFLPTMFLVCKFHQYKRQQQESNRKKITEKELSHLNHKIDKLLNKLEEHDSELASTPDEECVICISAKATMQTFPCGHRVVCRKCFVKTIQVAVSQRLLPLRCVICRAKILRLKQTTQGGIDTGTVLRNHVSAVGGHHHHHHHHSRSSLVASPSPSSSTSSSTTGSSINSPLANNPFFISPITSPVSPVTEVFREQRSVWARNYDSFGYDVTGQSPIPATPSPIVSTPTISSESSFFKTDLNLGSGCVLHKHCKHSNNGNDEETSSSGTCSCSTRNLSAKICSPSTSSSPSSSKSPIVISGFSQSSFAASSSNTSASSSPYTDSPHQSNTSTTTSPSSSSTSSSFTPICPTAPNPWQFQINRKRRHRLAHRRRRGHYVPSGRPTSLLLPIDEKDEWHEENSADHEMVAHKSSSSMVGFSPSFLSSNNYRSKRKQLKEKLSSSRNYGDDEEEDERLGAAGQVNDENDYHYSDDELSSEEDDPEEEEEEEEEEETESSDVALMYKETSLDEAKNDSRRDSVKYLLDTSQNRSSIASSSPINHFTSSSKLSNAFMRAKNLVSKGKWRSH